MIGPLAIVALSVAVANDDGGEASLEERFRILYALGDKSAAYKLLFAAKAHLAEARKEVLQPLLFRLTEQMQGTKTLEELRDVLEEIEAILSGWSLWKPTKTYAAGFGLFDIVDRRQRRLAPGRKARDSATGDLRSPGYQVLAWSIDSASPSATADTPIFVDLHEVAPNRVLRAGQRGTAEDRLLGWDREGRALCVRQRWDTFGVQERIEITTLDAFWSEPF